MKMIQWGDAPIRWQEVACVARGEATLSLSDSAGRVSRKGGRLSSISLKPAR